MDVNITSTIGDKRDARESYAMTCAAIAVRDEVFRKTLFAYCGRELNGVQRDILAQVLNNIGSEEAAYQACLLMCDHLGPPVPDGVARLLERTFTEHVPLDEAASSYEVYQRASNKVRAHLFEMAIGDDARKNTALAMLISIENQRIQSGRPREEPRHPAIDTAGHWPLPGMHAAR